MNLINGVSNIATLFQRLWTNQAQPRSSQQIDTPPPQESFFKAAPFSGALKPSTSLCQRIICKKDEHQHIGPIQLTEDQGYFFSHHEDYTPLYNAAIGKAVEQARLLIDQDKLCVNKPNSESKFTPLHGAIFSNSPSIIRLLLEAGADPNQPSIDGRTSLHHAVFHDCCTLETIKLLFDAGAKLGAHDKSDLCGGKSPLDLAVNKVLALFFHGNIFEQYYYGYNDVYMKTFPLKQFTWVDHSNLKIFPAARPNIQDSQAHETLLFIFEKYVENYGIKEAIRILQNCINERTERAGMLTITSYPHYLASELHAAVLIGAIDITKHLVKEGHDVNQQAILSCTPLSFAAKLGSAQIMQILIDAGANVNHQDLYKMTPLHHACSSGSAEAIQLLLASGASCDQKDSQYKPPIFYAAHSGSGDALHLMLQATDQRTMDEILHPPQHLDFRHEWKKDFNLLTTAVRKRSAGSVDSILSVGIKCTPKNICQHLYSLLSSDKEQWETAESEEMALVLIRWGASADKSWPDDMVKRYRELISKSQPHSKTLMLQQMGQLRINSNQSFRVLKGQTESMHPRVFV